MILENRKIIFIHIPKTGGSSIEIALDEFSEDSIWFDNRGTYFTPRENTFQKIMMERIGIDKDNYKHATALQYKNILGEEYDDYFVFTVLRNPIKRLSSLYRWSKLSSESHFPSVDPHNKKDTPFMLANYFIQNESGDLIVDKIIDFDNLELEFLTLMKELEINIDELPHNNKTGDDNSTDCNMPNFDEKYKEEILLYNNFKDGELEKKLYV